MSHALSAKLSRRLLVWSKEKLDVVVKLKVLKGDEDDLEEICIQVRFQDS